jgi:hypothetical protein
VQPYGLFNNGCFKKNVCAKILYHKTSTLCGTSDDVCETDSIQVSSINEKKQVKRANPCPQPSIV